MSGVFVSRVLPHTLQAAICAAWLAGAADVVAIVAELGGGKGTAGLVLFGPLLLLGSRFIDAVRETAAAWRQWARALLLFALALPCLAALLYTRAAFDSWIHPSWF